MLHDIYNAYYQCASSIPNWESMSKTDLANAYCDAEEKGDEESKNKYYSALMLRYWGNVFKLFRESKSARLEIEDFASWLSESLNVAFKYKRWRDPNHKAFKDPDAVDKIINRCIYSTRKRYYTYFNKDKRKLNYTIFSADSYPSDLLDFHNNTTTFQDTTCRDIITNLLKRGKLEEAIIVDSICYQDTTQNGNFSRRKLLKELKELDASRFLVNKEDLNLQIKDIIDNFKTLNSVQLSRKITKTLNFLKKDKEVLNILCY